MMWVYAVILAFSAGLCSFVLSRVSGRIAAFFGAPHSTFNVLDFAALAVLGFLMVAQSPAMMLMAAVVLWFAGMRHQRTSLALHIRVGLVILAVMLGLASLDAPDFQVPTQIPKAAMMIATYIVWCLVTALPLGAPSHGLLASYGLSLAIFIAGIVLGAPHVLAADAIVIAGALLGALLSLHPGNAHATLGGQWAFLFLLGFLAASASYAGLWWLGLLGIAPVCVYALVRKT